MTSNKTIHFMRVVLRKPGDIIEGLQPGFWRQLVEDCQGLSEEDRTVPYMGQELRGEAFRDARTSLDAFYLAKSRSAMDRPHTRTDSGYVPIADGVEVNGVFEPAYGAAVGETNVAAFMRSSGGASWGAICQWLNHIYPPSADGTVLELQPVVGVDGLDALRQSSGVAKLHIQTTSDSLYGVSPEAGTIASAVREASNLAAGLTIDLQLSFGRTRPDTESAHALKDDLERYLQSHTDRRAASATLMFPAESGGFDRRPVDFIYNKITMKEHVDLDGDVPTRESVLLALQHAVHRYTHDDF